MDPALNLLAEAAGGRIGGGALEQGLHPDQTPGDAPDESFFTIVTRNNRPENIYIQSARLNGEPWNSFQLPHALFLRGGTLELDLGPKPNQQWGVK